MAASAKSLALLKELKDRLARRTTLAIGDISFDTDGGGWFLIGTGAAGTQSMVVKSKQIDPVGFDGIGLAARGYSQTVMQLVLETSTIANTSLLTAANFLPLLGEVLRQGSRVELYMSANTNTVDVTDITSGNLKVTWEPDLQFRTMDAS
jgi:hypothetical protein